MLGQLAQIGEVEPRRARIGELDRECAELRGERQERAEEADLVRGHRRDVDRVRDHAALESGGDLLGHDHARAVLSLLGRGGEVRRDDDVVEREERPGVRLLGEDVERGAGDLAGAERLDERLLVDELATGGVDELDPVLRRRELLPSDEPVRVLGEREMERGEVGGREELGKRLDPVDAELGEALGAHVGVEGEDAACPGRARAAPPGARCGRSRRGRASSRRARGRRSASAPSGLP